MGDKLIMSKKERNRKALLEQVVGGYLTLREAGQRMGVSYRQVKRIWRRYAQLGDQGLIHQSRGRTSTNAYLDEYRRAVISRYKERYFDFGPTLAAEHLQREGFEMCVETLRQWLLSEGLWSRHRKRKAYRQRRERSASFGDILQIDGSIHEWFVGVGKKTCLLNIVDDATGRCYAQLDTGETTAILLRCFFNWIVRYGIPKAVYVDLKNLYISPLEEGLSVFQQVCQRLHVRVIKAYSPQAKGRVERKHGLFQDRLVKELRLHEISAIAPANDYLEQHFLPYINKKYTHRPRCGEDAHRPISKKQLHQRVYQGHQRQVQNDWTVQLHNVYYQLEKACPLQVRAKQKVEIRQHVDGSISIWDLKGTQSLRFTKLEQKPVKEKPLKKAQRSYNTAHARRNTPWGTKQDWLWRNKHKNKDLNKRRRGQF